MVANINLPQLYSNIKNQSKYGNFAETVGNVVHLCKSS